ncbi:MAG: serine hydrolase domain-containing protein [Hyphomonadaceae bacterium]
MNNKKKFRLGKRSILAIGLAGALVLFAASCEQLPVILDHNARLKPIPATDRMIGEQTAIPAKYESIITDANLILEQAVTSMQLPAISIAIGLDGELIWARALGLRDLENGTPVSLDTRFRIGSTAKALTGTLAARLVEESILDLDAPISGLVPYYPAKPHDITTRHLLTHTAGIRHYEGAEYYSRKTHENVESAVDVFSRSPLKFDPGTGFAYSSYGYVLASASMEGASGLSFDELIEEKLATPLDMPNTMREGLALGDFATPYEIRGGKYKTPFPADNSNRTAGGGFVATPTDLVLMTQEIMTGDYLTSSTKETLLYTPQKLTNGDINEQNYALGWRSHNWNRMFEGERDVFIAHHYGKASGSESFLAMFPEYNLSISIVTNRNLEDTLEFSGLIIPIAEKIIQQR